MTIHETLQKSKLPLSEKEILLASVLEQDRSFLKGFRETKLTESQIRRFKRLNNRRENSEPLAYLLGHKEFFGLKFLVNQSVLIPRPETEALVEQALKYLENKVSPTLVDVGTGSGCIAIAIAKNNPEATIYATDISEEALEVARKNARLNNVSKRIIFIKTNLLEAVKDKLNLIVANLPYIPEERYPNLAAEIVNFEPKEALISGKTSTKIYEKLFSQAKTKLHPEGKIFYEIDGEILTKGT
jgi:release factor glutamine methyltransferase